MGASIMPTSTIFIASSKKSKPIAEALVNILRQEMGDALQVREWWVNCFGLGENTLASLLEHCRRSDFAAVLLTKDDPEPSDNCVFEAGMFTGVFGVKGKGERGEARRCFLLSSIPREKLLSDLNGITFQEIEEIKSSQSIHLAASKIRDAIRELGPVSKPEIECYTEEELLERERVVGDGGCLEWGSEVMVNLTRPIEVSDPIFAKRVFKNMQANVHYKYFFSAAENLRLIAQLFYSIATADADSPTVTPSGTERNRKIELNLARMQRQCGIWFLSSSRPFEFCVHNADRDAAVCYLRRPNDRRFVDWCAGDKAIEIVKDMQRSMAASANKVGDGYAVFRPSRDFHLSDAQRATLEKEVKILFDEDIHERVLNLCFGMTPKHASTSQAARPRRTRSAQ
jgi:hypothetical protein